MSGPLGGRSGEGGFRQDLDNHGAYIPVVQSLAENQRGELFLSDVANALTGGGGKPGQGYAAVAFHLTQDPISSEVVAPNLSAGNRQGCATVGVAHSIAVRGRQDGQAWELGEPEVGNALRAGDGGSSRGNWALTPAMAVRRLTPLECLRLQGYPDDWLDGLGLADSTKYRMVGNSIAVPVVEWLARRLVTAD